MENGRGVGRMRGERGKRGGEWRGGGGGGKSN